MCGQTDAPFPPLRSSNSFVHELLAVCAETNVSMDRWISRLGACGWLQAVSDTLTCAATVAQCVHCEGSAGMYVLCIVRLFYPIVPILSFSHVIHSSALVIHSFVFQYIEDYIHFGRKEGGRIGGTRKMASDLKCS